MITLALFLLLIILLGRVLGWLFPRVKGNNLTLTKNRQTGETLSGTLLVLGSKITAGNSSKGYSYVDGLASDGLSIRKVVTTQPDFAEYLTFLKSDLLTTDHDGILVELPLEGKQEDLEELLRLLRQKTTAPIMIFSIVGVDLKHEGYEKLITGVWDLKQGFDFTFVDFWHNRHLAMEAKNHLSYMLSATDPTIAGQQALYLPRLAILVKDTLELADSLTWEMVEQA